MKPTDPAFPYHKYAYQGINIRLFIAAHALQGLVSGSQPFADTDQRLFAKVSLALADALLDAENHKP